MPEGERSEHVPVPGHASESQEPGQADEQDRKFTLEEVESLVKEAEDRAVIRAQSHTDKVFSNVQEDLSQVDRLTGMFEEEGVEVSPDAKERIESKVMKEGLFPGQQEEPEQGEPNGEPEAPEEPSGGNQTSYWNGLSEEAGELLTDLVEKGEGSYLAPNDPESEALQDPELLELAEKHPMRVAKEYLERVERQSKRKKARLERSPAGAGLGGSPPPEGGIMDLETGDDGWDAIQDDL